MDMLMQLFAFPFSHYSSIEESEAGTSWKSQIAACHHGTEKWSHVGDRSLDSGAPTGRSWLLGQLLRVCFLRCTGCIELDGLLLLYGPSIWLFATLRFGSRAIFSQFMIHETQFKIFHNLKQVLVCKVRTNSQYPTDIRQPV